jgi:predicted N-formylglutamate amidohydrolase
MTQPPDPDALHAEKPLLAADEPAPVWTYNAGGSADVLLLCDHAHNFVPRALDQLGVPTRALQRHIAYDIGIAPVTRMLADALDAPAVFSHFSRLIVDPNRQLDDPTLTPVIADETEVPGNRGLSPADLEARLATFFWPYHARITEVLDAMQARGRHPALIAMHSFTPVMRGRARPWEVGILWDYDARLPVPMMEAFAGRGWTVGDNEPYSARDGHGYTQHVHGDKRGVANALIEIRQDLIDTQAGQRAWAAETHTVLRAVLQDPDIYRPYRR